MDGKLHLFVKLLHDAGLGVVLGDQGFVLLRQPFRQPLLLRQAPLQAQLLLGQLVDVLVQQSKLPRRPDGRERVRRVDPLVRRRARGGRTVGWSGRKAEGRRRLPARGLGSDPDRAPVRLRQVPLRAVVQVVRLDRARAAASMAAVWLLIRRVGSVGICSVLNVRSSGSSGGRLTDVIETQHVV